MVDVKVRVLGDMFPRVFLTAMYKDGAMKEFELLGFSSEKFIERDIDFFRHQHKVIDDELYFASEKLEDAARDYTSKISSRDFVMLDSLIDEMDDNLKRVENYTKIRESIRAAIFYFA